MVKNSQNFFLTTFDISIYQKGLVIRLSGSKIEKNPVPSKTGEISTFIVRCIRLNDGNNAEAQVQELTKHLKENPPKESYENPILPDGPCTLEQKNLAQFIYCYGIDLP